MNVNLNHVFELISSFSLSMFHSFHASLPAPLLTSFPFPPLFPLPPGGLRHAHFRVQAHEHDTRRLGIDVVHLTCKNACKKTPGGRHRQHVRMLANFTQRGTKFLSAYWVSLFHHSRPHKICFTVLVKLHYSGFHETPSATQMHNESNLQIQHLAAWRFNTPNY